MCPDPFVEVHPDTASKYQLEHEEVVRLYTRRGEVFYKVKITEAIRKDTVFVPYHWDFEKAANILTNPALDPISKMPEFKACAAQMEKLKTTFEKE